MKPRLLFPLFLLLALLSSAKAVGPVGVVGVTYKVNLPDIPSHIEVVKALIAAGVPRVRLINPDLDSLTAFANTGIDLNLSLEDINLVQVLADNASHALSWVRTTVLPAADTVLVSSISVGYGVLTRNPELAHILLPAVTNVYYACRNLSLARISVSTAHSYDIVSAAFPPSSAEFNASFVPFLKPLIEFDAATNGAFHIDLYPFHLFRKRAIDKVTLPFVMFEAREDEFLLDEGTVRKYRNLYDIMVDGAVVALARMGHPTLPILVVGTGWPSSGDRKAVPEAMGLYAAEYNERIVVRLNMFSGTPLRPMVTPVTYIYSLFDEMIDKDPKSIENNWGIMENDLSLKYDINFRPTNGGRAVSDGWSTLLIRVSCFVAAALFLSSSGFKF